MGSTLREPISAQAVYLCIDMQNIFMPGAPWATPWMARVAPVIAEITARFAKRTVFTRFMTPLRPEDMPGMWQRYYQRWRRVTRAEIDPTLLELIPELKGFSPPATVIDKMHYSPFTEPNLKRYLRHYNIDTLFITGAETDVCVLAAVLGAIDRGFRTIVVTDVICSSTDEGHDDLMNYYHMRFTEQVETANAEVVLFTVEGQLGRARI
jgi:nicotinamidase-related amidase